MTTDDAPGSRGSSSATSTCDPGRGGSGAVAAPVARAVEAGGRPGAPATARCRGVEPPAVGCG